MSEQRIMTIGHGNLAFGEVETWLQSNGVRMIVDVRSEPYSRHAPDFTKSSLQDLAAVAGLGYRWMGDRLGGRPSPDSPAQAPVAFESAIDELCALAAGGLVVVLCAEIDPRNCHRATTIAPALEARGFAVHHIEHGGGTTRHQPALFPRT